MLKIEDGIPTTKQLNIYFCNTYMKAAYALFHKFLCPLTSKRLNSYLIYARV